MTAGAERGVAYAFWLKVKAEQAARGWTDAQLKEASGGVAHTTVDRLQRGRRPPSARVVNGLADALSIDRAEAYKLAGRPTYDPAVDGDEDASEPTDEVRAASAREAIRLDPMYEDWQKDVLIRVMDVLESAFREHKDGQDGHRATG